MADILQVLKNKLSGLIKTSKTGSVIGVDIGSSAVKVVQLKNKEGSAVLETYGGVSLAPYSDGEIGQVLPVTEEQIIAALTDVFKEANVTTKDAVVAIPSAASLVFTLELPSQLAEGNLREAVPLEARRHIPVPISEVSLDWWMIPKSPIIADTDDSFVDEKKDRLGATKVLVAAIHNDALHKYQNVVSEAKLQTGFFEIEMFSNVRSCVGHELATVMLVDFGAAKTKVSVVERGVIQDFHIINRGGHNMTTNLATGLNLSFKKAEEIKKRYGLAGDEQYPKMKESLESSFEYIFSEINNAILSYEKKYNKAITKIYFTGGGSTMSGLVPYAKNKFPTDVYMADPFEKTQAPAFLEPVLEDVGPEFSVAVGLALRKLS